MNYNKLNTVIYSSCTKETCYPRYYGEWTIKAPLMGHSDLAALIINEYLGGDIIKLEMPDYDLPHYFNYVNEEYLDSTRGQFGDFVFANCEYEIEREELLSDEDTLERYNKFKENVDYYLNLLDELNKEALECRTCGSLVENFGTKETIHYGKVREILVLGEAPANDGWRKSGKCWYGSDSKITASGAVMNKLLKPYNLEVEDLNFIEAAKCFPKERKNLKKCCLNCNNLLTRQIDVINPDIIITMGDHATRSILKEKYDKFSDVVGKVYEKDNDTIIIPIYHPSPANPKGYNNNIEIFDMIFNEYM